MEDGLDYLKSKDVEHFFLTKEFNKYCPFYISLGMSYEQFWEGDPTIALYYLEAYRMKEKREIEKSRWMMWEQGLYVYEAICDVAPILRAFSKATKPLPYPEKPHGLEKTEQDKGKELEEKKQNDRNKPGNWQRIIWVF